MTRTSHSIIYPCCGVCVCVSHLKSPLEISGWCSWLQPITRKNICAVVVAASTANNNNNLIISVIFTPSPNFGLIKEKRASEHTRTCCHLLHYNYTPVYNICVCAKFLQQAKQLVITSHSLCEFCFRHRSTHYTSFRIMLFLVAFREQLTTRAFWSIIQIYLNVYHIHQSQRAQNNCPFLIHWKDRFAYLH